MVSLHSVMRYFSHPKPTPELSDDDKQQIQRLLRWFGGWDNIEQVDACITRLRVTVKNLSLVDSQGLQQEGALGVIILGQQVHAIFGKQSDTLRKLLEDHFSRPE
ncbi:PTS transporter subunit EIIB [Dickeya solani]|uniref:PTS transport protein n=1 Tax=Dickeya solani D s0432-1 TaxID=1231725 RepID=A0AAV3K7Q0_9GAMM|nr:PTS glucose/sucrose transporter subunit IIB [Dickeya solani]ANE74299.1 PTS sugar transporter [Dickeya solani IPO 2222]AUC41513.1 PTS system, glucose-specific IIBC component [Dickeya solani RNS 08.23.3.1.A]AUH10287.1 PTS sugar transporter [Dickeya solani D s0432-1]AUH14230.1 PTS sugar transporter [Dickeya solani]AYQ48758.1 PTS system glucose-specific EIICB component [Dickeya solani]